MHESIRDDMAGRGGGPPHGALRQKVPEYQGGRELDAAPPARDPAVRGLEDPPSRENHRRLRTAARGLPVDNAS
eukprot:16120129-Heterocapsa_arctica.AAC.1